MISFIVPAHNEQAGIGRTLQAINDSARVVGQPYEIIVVDDACTDATAEIARQHNAIVVPVNHRQIAATRNSGGRAAHGERLFFVDADTIINPRAVAASLRCMDKGAVGGGAPVKIEGIVPLYIQLIAVAGVIPAKVLGVCGGAFMYCTREAFLATGGFDERLFWGEEGIFALALKRRGRFVVIWRRVLTSGRRFRVMSGLQVLARVGRMALSPSAMFSRNPTVKKIWYDSNRENDDIMPGTLGVKVSNGIALLMLIVMLSGPVWNFIPLSLTPWDSPLGRIRFVIGTFLSHVGLLFWPCAIVVFMSLLRGKQWWEWIKLAALFAFCVWQAWDCTQGVIWHWTRIYHWLAHFHAG
jgi:glycosyltransferase involved in cell wall biosynthesis